MIILEDRACLASNLSVWRGSRRMGSSEFLPFFSGSAGSPKSVKRRGSGEGAITFLRRDQEESFKVKDAELKGTVRLAPTRRLSLGPLGGFPLKASPPGHKFIKIVGKS